MKLKIDTDWADFKEQADLDEWLTQFQEVVEYIKKKAEETILPK